MPFNRVVCQAEPTTIHFLLTVSDYQLLAKKKSGNKSAKISYFQKPTLKLLSVPKRFCRMPCGAPTKAKGGRFQRTINTSWVFPLTTIPAKMKLESRPHQL